MRLVLLALAGSVGTLARYGVYQASQRLAAAWGFPLATFLVNVIGSFLMGMVVTLALAKVSNADLRLVAGVGFLGAFTTFSTFALDTVNLAEGRAWDRMALYLVGNLGLGVAAVLAGRFVAVRINGQG